MSTLVQGEHLGEGRPKADLADGPAASPARQAWLTSAAARGPAWRRPWPSYLKSVFGEVRLDRQPAVHVTTHQRWRTRALELRQNRFGEAHESPFVDDGVRAPIGPMAASARQAAGTAPTSRSRSSLGRHRSLFWRVHCSVGRGQFIFWRLRAELRRAGQWWLLGGRC